MKASGVEASVEEASSMLYIDNTKVNWWMLRAQKSVYETVRRAAIGCNGFKIENQNCASVLAINIIDQCAFEHLVNVA